MEGEKRVSFLGRGDPGLHPGHPNAAPREVQDDPRSQQPAPEEAQTSERKSDPWAAKVKASATSPRLAPGTSVTITQKDLEAQRNRSSPEAALSREVATTQDEDTDDSMRVRDDAMEGSLADDTDKYDDVDDEKAGENSPTRGASGFEKFMTAAARMIERRTTNVPPVIAEWDRRGEATMAGVDDNTNGDAGENMSETRLDEENFGNNPGTDLAIQDETGTDVGFLDDGGGELELAFPRVRVHDPNAPFYRFRERSKGRAFEAQIEVYESMVDKEAEYEEKNVVLLDEEELEEKILKDAAVRAFEMLPPAVQESAAAPLVGKEIMKKSGSNYVSNRDALDPVIDEIRSTGYLPYTTVHMINQVREDLFEKSVENVLGKVFPNLPKPEVLERTVAALNQSDHPAAADDDPLVVNYDEYDGRYYVSAKKAAQIIDAETDKEDGLVLGRSDAIVELHRPNGVKEVTFLNTVGVVQDLTDPNLSLVFSLEQGMLPSPGRRVKEGEEDLGKLAIDSVAVSARNFEIRMHNALNAPRSTNRTESGLGGWEINTQERERVQLEKAVRFLTRQEDIGLVKKKVHVSRSAETTLGLPAGSGSVPEFDVSEQSTEYDTDEADITEAVIVGEEQLTE